MALAAGGGHGNGQLHRALAGQRVVNGSTAPSFGDQTKPVLMGVTKVDASMFG